MSSLLCHLFGHVMAPRHEWTGACEVRVLMMPFGFDLRPFIVLWPKQGRRIGSFCLRCDKTVDAAIDRAMEADSEA